MEGGGIKLRTGQVNALEDFCSWKSELQGDLLKECFWDGQL